MSGFLIAKNNWRLSRARAPYLPLAGRSLAEGERVGARAWDSYAGLPRPVRCANHPPRKGEGLGVPTARIDGGAA